MRSMQRIKERLRNKRLNISFSTHIFKILSKIKKNQNNLIQMKEDDNFKMSSSLFIVPTVHYAF